MKRITQIVTVLMMVSAVASAAPVKLNNIPASSKWAVHFDNEAARKTDLSKGIMTMVMDKVKDKSASGKERMIAGKILFFYDKLKVLKSVTLFGPSEKENEAVLVISADYNAGMLCKLIGITEKNRTYSYNGHKIVSAKSKFQQKDIVICFYDKKTVIGGQSLDKVSEAIDLIDGKKDVRHLSAEMPLGWAMKNTKGSVLTAGAIGIGEMIAAKHGKRGKCLPLFKKISAASIDLGARANKNYFSMKLVMDRDESAQQLAAMAKGFKAMIGFMNNDKMPKVVMRIVNSIKVKEDGRVVSVSVKALTADLLEIAKKHHEMMKKRMGGAKRKGKCPKRGR